MQIHLEANYNIQSVQIMQVFKPEISPLLHQTNQFFDLILVDGLFVEDMETNSNFLVDNLFEYKWYVIRLAASW